MATSFVHIGDFHAAPGPRNADRYRALDQVITDGLAIPNLGAWLWPGDLSHARQTIEDKNALSTRLQRMAERAPVLLCYGNHDLPGDLDVFARLAAPHPIYVIDRPQCVRIRLASMGFAMVFVLPYPTKAGLTAMGVAPADVIDTASAALDHIFMAAAGELEAARVQGDLTLMIGHVNVGGAITSSGQPNIGHEIEISAAHLDRLGPIPKLLNHIHVAQEIAGAHYAGSICRLSWGEIEPKRWLQVDCAMVPACEVCGSPATCFGAYESPDAEAAYACDRCCGHGNEDGWCKPISEGGIAGAARCLTFEVFSHPVDVAPMYHVEGVLSRERFDWVVKDGPDGQPLEAPTSWAGCEVRVRYRFNASEKRLLEQAKARILAEFAEASRLELEPVAVPDRALRAPEVAAAKTLAEKVHAWASLNGTVVSEAVLTKLVALEHAEATVTLSGVQRAIDALVTPASEKAEAAA